jgi:hypothetical protein
LPRQRFWAALSSGSRYAGHKNRIKKYRKEKGLIQEKLAELCETAPAYIGLLKTGRVVQKLSVSEQQPLKSPIPNLRAQGHLFNYIVPWGIITVVAAEGLPPPVIICAGGCYGS